jgi:Transposase
VFLYDVTSSYLEGQKHELAAPGYNRDGKRFKKQIVLGLLTDGTGEPLSVQLYAGNTSDPQTVEDQVKKLVERFGAAEAVVVGDRGMLRTKGKTLIQEHGFHYVSSLTDPEIRKLLSTGTLQIELFDEHVSEVQGTDGVRYVLRRNAASAERARSRRADQLKRVLAKVERRNESVEKSSRSKPDVSLAHATKWLQTYKLQGFASARLDERQVVIEIDPAAREEVERLDGCYVVVSDVPRDAGRHPDALGTATGDKQRVERDFPHHEDRTAGASPPSTCGVRTRKRGHALVTMLALRITRELERRVRPLGLTCQDALDRLQQVRLVTLADPDLGLWRLPTRWPTPVQRLLDALPPLPAPLLSQYTTTG